MEGRKNITFHPGMTNTAINVDYDYVFKCKDTMFTNFTIDLHIINDSLKVICDKICGSQIIIMDGMSTCNSI